jgi:uncharacterized protein
MNGVGIGFRHPHYREVLQTLPALGFLEVHSENFFGEGGAALSVLQQARSHYALSLHGVGLALGSAAGLDPWHLDRLAQLVQRIEPARVSDHACFARVATEPPGHVVHANDLLPIAFTPASLGLMVEHVSRVQDRLRRPILVENLSAYVGWQDDSIAEPQFFNELARRSGCGMLLDLNNIVVNALNAGQEPVAMACAFVDCIDAGIVGEIHLAGYCDTNEIVIDDHGSRVHEPVWAVYRHAMQRLAHVPVLIEWDTDVPALDVLIGEARQAERHRSVQHSAVETPA